MIEASGLRLRIPHFLGRRKSAEEVYTDSLGEKSKQNIGNIYSALKNGRKSLVFISSAKTGYGGFGYEIHAVNPSGWEKEEMDEVQKALKSPAQEKDWFINKGKDRVPCLYIKTGIGEDSIQLSFRQAIPEDYKVMNMANLEKFL